MPTLASDKPGKSQPRPAEQPQFDSPVSVSAEPPVARQIGRPAWWVDLLVLAWLFLVYDLINGLAPLRLAAAERHGSDILSLEHALHIAPELALNTWLQSQPWLALFLADFYDVAHGFVTFGLLLLLWWKLPARYRQLRNILVWTNVVGLIVFWRFPVAPPRLLPHSGFTDTISQVNAIGSSHGASSLAAHANQFAAMPSLHIAWALWCSLAIWALVKAPWGKALAVAYPMLTAFAVLATGNHYLIDVLAGAATLAIAMLLVRASVWQRKTLLVRSRRKEVLLCNQ